MVRVLSIPPGQLAGTLKRSYEMLGDILPGDPGDRSKAALVAVQLGAVGAVTRGVREAQLSNSAG